MRQDGGFPPFGEPGIPPNLVLPPNAGSLAKWGLVILLVVVLVIFLSFLRSVYTDWLWFDSLGVLSVFTTVLWTKVLLFFIGAAIFGLLVGVNLWIARRGARGESVLPLPRETLRLMDRLLLLATILGAIVLAVLFGFSAASRWEMVLRLANGVSFGVADPVLNKDVSFYVFTLPVWRFVQGWFLSSFVVLLLAVGLLHMAHAALRGIPFRITGAVRGHLVVLGSLVFFDLAASHFLGRYERLFTQGGAVFGAGYTDIHARIPALFLLTAVAIAAGVMLLATLAPALRGPRGTRLIMGAVGLWVAAMVLGGTLYPAFVQRFTVEPNELVQEKQYIERNIAFTRAAFGLDRVKETTIQAQREMPAETLLRNPEIIGNLRLWDPRPLKDTYKQAQFHRSYYDFLDVDVDRYIVDGKYRQVLVSARELDQDKLRPEAKNWVNQRLQFTHGYGAVASPATEFTAEGQPIFFAKDIPPTGSIPITRPEIYYGERSPNFIIVNARTEELDYEPKEGTPIYKNYEGRGGVPLSSFLRRAAYAWQFGDINILISDQVTPTSRIQYRRSIQEQIHQVAPFLKLDKDPYLVIEDGRLRWVQDGYTTTDRYPYSTPYRNSVNYIRNSVKVVVDAYDGSMDFYVSDPEDPLIQTYQGIFPALFKPLSAMSPFTKAHMRYPEDMFSIQAETYMQYHMTDPNQFFNKADQFDVPEETFFGTQQRVLPYYVNMKLPGEQRVEFALILPLTLAPTQEKPKMVAWLAARMDAPNYGELVSFIIPRGSEIHGPSQVEARIDQDFAIKQQFALLCTGEASCIRGNLLVVPVEDSILYVEPLYLQSANVPFPELKRVILASGTKVVMEPSLDKAVAALVGAPAAPTQPTTPTQPPSTPTQAAQQLERIQEVLKGLKEGLTSLEEAVKQLNELLKGGTP
ncbi:MAG: UPF0182 family protein [Chloroflexi bacterium]|nr:UPF0182 family protein [Chloroflexota bacterium]